MIRVGYIGLGLMGKSIARNILKAGFPLVVHNRSQAAVDELVGEGARAANSPAEVASLVDVVFTNLPDTPDVEKVALEAGGIIEGAHAGLIFVDNSTIKPAAARSISQTDARKRHPVPGCPGKRRGYRSSQRHAGDYGRRACGGLGNGPSGISGNGENDHSCRRGRGRTDRQGG